LPRLSEIENPSQVIVMFEEESYRPEGTNAVFLDGHVSTLPKTPEQIQEQIAQEFAGRPVGFEVARAEALPGEAADMGARLGFAYERPAAPPALLEERAAAGEFRGAQRQQLAQQVLKDLYERKSGQKAEDKEGEPSFVAATVFMKTPASQPVAEAQAGRAKGAMPMLLSLPTGGDRYRLYQPFVEREPGGFVLTLLARRPFQWGRALLFLVVTGGFLAVTRRWPRGGLAAGGAVALALLLVQLTSTGGVRLLSEAALGATVVSLMAAGIIYQRRQSAKEVLR